MEAIEKIRNVVKSGRDTRLFNEWERLDEACSASNEITYTVSKTNTAGLPVAYQIVFRIKSITGVEEPDAQGLQWPVFGDEHVLQINLPNNYPAVDGGMPDIKFVTAVWHPNVRYFGDFKGRVCLSLSDRGTAVCVADHVAQIADYLRYIDYHARNEPPFPEDQTVAKWVREQAEPHRMLKDCFS